MRGRRLALVALVWLAAFVGLANAAPVANGVWFVLGIGPLFWAGTVALDWARRV